MQELPLIRLAFPEVRQILERCGCRCSCLMEYGAVQDTDDVAAPAVYAFERDHADGLLVTVVHVWDDAWPVPLPVLRSMCENLGLVFDVFSEPQ